MGFDSFHCPVCGTTHANRGLCWSCRSRQRHDAERLLDEQRRTADTIAYAAEAQMAHERAVALASAAHQEELERDRKREAERSFVHHALHEIASQEVDNLARARARVSVFLGTEEYRRNPKLTETVVLELGLEEAYLGAVLTRMKTGSAK
ncbi:MAG: hypothetical protein EOP84_02505, partial [Verrucomicrobiaceae bacterium]